MAEETTKPKRKPTKRPATPSTLDPAAISFVTAARPSPSGLTPLHEAVIASHQSGEAVRFDAPNLGDDGARAFVTEFRTRIRKSTRALRVLYQYDDKVMTLWAVDQITRKPKAGASA